MLTDKRIEIIARSTRFWGTSRRKSEVRGKYRMVIDRVNDDRNVDNYYIYDPNTHTTTIRVSQSRHIRRGHYDHEEIIAPKQLSDAIRIIYALEIELQLPGLHD